MTPDESQRLTRIEEAVKYIQRSVDELKDTTVTRSEFEPVKKLVYGATAGILLLFLSTVGALVFIR